MSDEKMVYDIAKLKEQHRRDLAKLSFDEKIPMLIRMQKIAREMARAGNSMASCGASARVSECNSPIQAEV
ncbi:hypothetical protein HUU05_08190 [candidate division KSB1 bacterium]|nr:hypothetical protein [candidate division KSB1 bacterium]